MNIIQRKHIKKFFPVIIGVLSIVSFESCSHLHMQMDRQGTSGRINKVPPLPPSSSRSRVRHLPPSSSTSEASRRRAEGSVAAALFCELLLIQELQSGFFPEASEVLNSAIAERSVGNAGWLSRAETVNRACYAVVGGLGCLSWLPSLIMRNATVIAASAGEVKKALADLCTKCINNVPLTVNHRNVLGMSRYDKCHAHVEAYIRYTLLNNSERGWFDMVTNDERLWLIRSALGAMAMAGSLCYARYVVKKNAFKEKCIVLEQQRHLSLQRLYGTFSFLRREYETSLAALSSSEYYNHGQDSVDHGENIIFLRKALFDSFRELLSEASTLGHNEIHDALVRVCMHFRPAGRHAVKEALANEDPQYQALVSEIRQNCHIRS